MYYLIGGRAYRNGDYRFLIFDSDTMFIYEVTAKYILEKHIKLENISSFEIDKFFAHKGVFVTTGTDTVTVMSNGTARILYTNILGLTGKTVINEKVPFQYIPYFSERCGLFTEEILEFDLLLNGHYFYFRAENTADVQGYSIKINDIEFTMYVNVPFAIGYDVVCQQFLLILSNNTGDTGWFKFRKDGKVELDYAEAGDKNSCVYGADGTITEDEFRKLVNRHKRELLLS